MDSETLQNIHAAFDAPRAIKTASLFYKTDRAFTFSAFHKTSRTAVREMEKAGLRDVEIHRFPADGRTCYGDWRVPRAWEVTTATLRIKAGSKYVTIADRESDLCSTIMYSAPTPDSKPCTCELVSQNDPAHWDGNLVFVEKPGLVPLEKLASKGALGIVTDFMPEWKDCRDRTDVYDTCLWNNGLFAPDNRFDLVGFQVSPRNGDLVRTYLAQAGPLKARAHVDARLHDGTIDFVTGILPGTKSEQEEVAFFAHLYEVGAHDNASGCAASIEVCRTIKTLIEQKKLKPLRRSIRLCFTFEIFGSLAFFEKYPERAEPIVAALNPDMVGGDLEQIRSRLQVHVNPDSVPSYTDALITHYVQRIYNRAYLLRWTERPFMINDNIVADPVLNMPCPALIELRDRFYHSSGDTPDKLSPSSMQAVGAAMTAYAYTIARGSSKDALALADMIMSRELQKIPVRPGPENPPAEDVIRYRLTNAAARLNSIKSFLKERKGRAAVEKYINNCIASLRAFAEEFSTGLPQSRIKAEWKRILSPPAALQKKAAALFPCKERVGTFTYGLLTEDERQGLPPGSAWGYQGNAPMFWADGSRSLFDIWKNCCIESGRPIALNEILNLFYQLEKHGYVSIRRR